MNLAYTSASRARNYCYSLRLDVGADEHILYKPIQIQVLHSVAEKLVANTNAIP